MDSEGKGGDTYLSASNKHNASPLSSSGRKSVSRGASEGKKGGGSLAGMAASLQGGKHRSGEGRREQGEKHRSGESAWREGGEVWPAGEQGEMDVSDMGVGGRSEGESPRGGASTNQFDLVEFGDGFGVGLEGDAGLSERALRRRQLTQESVVSAEMVQGAGSGWEGKRKEKESKRRSWERDGSSVKSGEVNSLVMESGEKAMGGGEGVMMLQQPCGVCFEEPMLGNKTVPPVVMVALQPCGHVLCAQCALQVVGADSAATVAPSCPFCRQSILGAGLNACKEAES